MSVIATVEIKKTYDFGFEIGAKTTSGGTSSIGSLEIGLLTLPPLTAVQGNGTGVLVEAEETEVE